MTTIQANDIANIDANKYRGVLIKWPAVIADQQKKTLILYSTKL